MGRPDWPSLDLSSSARIGHEIGVLTFRLFRSSFSLPLVCLCLVSVQAVKPAAKGKGKGGKEQKE
jgi:hypothetical protein